jgi:REP element-mobilizing transposase RayT
METACKAGKPRRGDGKRQGSQMANTFASVYYHVIFATKDRRPDITHDIRARLYEYIGGTVRGENGVPLMVGGTTDHVHILLAMRTEPSVAAMVKRIKANSSKWIHETFPHKAKFGWQAGYGVFSVSKSNADEVRAYIENQAEHHRKKTFREEFVAFLERHGVEYDERYLPT